MGFTVNTSNEESAKLDRKLYTGVMAVRVIAINPDQAKLKELGYKADKEPEYWFDEYGRKLDFIFEATVGGQPYHIRESIFVKGEYVKTKEGEKVQFIDKFGNTAFMSKADIASKTKPYEAFELDGARAAVKGEENLHKLLKAYAGVKKGEEARLADMKAIINGELKQIQDIITQANSTNNMIKVLAGVQDGKYPTVFSGNYLYIFQNSYNYLHKDYKWAAENGKLRGEFGPIDAKVFNANDFKVREYVISTENEVVGSTSGSNSNAAPVAPPAWEAAAESNPFGSAPEPVLEGAGADGPFVEGPDKLPF